MNFKKIMLVSVFLLAILTIGSVCASEDVDALTVDDSGDEQVIETPVGDVDDSDVLGVNPADFNVTFNDNEIDIKDYNAKVLRFYWPEDATADVIVDVEGGSAPWFVKEAGETYKDVDLGELYIFEPGTYNLTVKYDYNTVIAKGTLKVTKTYTADDFLDIMNEVNADWRDVVNVWDEEGLNGLVTVYANGKQVYSQNLVAGPSEGVLIYVDNLTGNFNGQYKIKAVYKRFDGKDYAKEETVTFTGVGTPTPTVITASAMSITYNTNKYLVATLKDTDGNVISGVDVKIGIMGISYSLTTDKNGQVKASVGQLPPGTRAVTFTFNGNANYAKSTKSVKVTVAKATPKLTAAKATFKKSVATKKYTVTLKDNMGKIMNGKKVTLKVNGKKLTATTNAKGQATFKITNLKKKGTFTAVVNFAGNSYYNAKTVKPKITVK